MNTFKTLLKAELLKKFRAVKPKGSAIGSVFSILIYGVVLGVFVLLEKGLVESFSNMNMNYEILALTLCATMLIQIVVGMSKTAEALIYDKGNSVINPLPISTFTIVAVKLSALFIEQLITSFILTFPLLICYYVVVKASFSFIFIALFSIILQSVVALFVSVLILFPYVYVKRFLDKFSLAKLILSVVALIVIFYAYDIALKLINQLIVQNHLELLFTQSNARVMTVISDVFTPANLLARIMLNKNLALALPLCLAMLILLPILSLLIASCFKSFFFFKQIRGYEFFNKPTDKPRTPFYALMKKEVLSIIRKEDGKFSYVSILITLPALIYMSFAVLDSAIYAYIGGGYTYAFFIFTLLCFSMTVSATFGDLITREGKGFTVAKTLPIAMKKQLFVKVLCPVALVSCSVILSVIIVLCTGYITIAEAASAVACALLMNASVIFFSLNRDIVAPMKSDSNAAKGIIGALLTALAVTAVSLLLKLVNKVFLVHVFVVLAGVIMLAFSLFVLFRSVEEKVMEARI